MKRVFYIPDRTHGPGPIFFCWQKRKGAYVVTTGFDNTIFVYDRHGEKVNQINLPGYCASFSWDSEGEILGAVTDRSPSIILWNSSTQRAQQVDTGLHDQLCFAAWAKTSQILAVGTVKGNLLIYNHRNARKVPILGKHSKKIISGVWSDRNLLALAGEDKLITISNEEGDTICRALLKGDPSLLKFANIRVDDRNNNLAAASAVMGQENTVSVIVNKRTLYLLHISDPENPVVLAFQDRYGTVVDYHWFGENFVLIGFSTGCFVVVSTRVREMGQEIASVRAHRDVMTGFSICPGNKRIASCSENVIKVHDFNDLEDCLAVYAVDEEKAIDSLAWSDDGQLLGATSPHGALHVFLTQLPILGDAFGTRLAYLSSLLEVTVVNVGEVDLNSDGLMVVRVDVEPSVIAVGPFHVAITMNNRAWFYALSGNGTVDSTTFLLREREYVAIVKDLKLNGDFAAARFNDGRIQLHVIENECEHDSDLGGDDRKEQPRETKTFPDGYGGIGSGKITCHAMTNELLIFATDSGVIEFYSLEDWATVNVHRHESSIKLLSPDMNGIKCFFMDERNDAYVYNVVSDIVLAIDQSIIPVSVKKVLWDVWPLDRGVFAAVDTKSLHVYSYVRDSVDGAKADYVGKMKLPQGQFPLLLYNGVAVCQTQSGKTSNFVLTTHDFTDKMSDRNKVRDTLLPDILKLRRYPDAWKICDYLNETEPWISFAKAALSDLNLELAIKVFRHIGYSSQVQALENLLSGSVEERNLLAAYMAMYCREYDLAQQLFLTSSRPQEALEMRVSILHWDEALRLAAKMAPEKVSHISLEYATQLEYSGDYPSALENYERALIALNQDLDDNESNLQKLSANEDIKLHNYLCKMGIARNAIRCGNARRGIDYALQIESVANQVINSPEIDEQLTEFYNTCGEILEGMKMFGDAGLLYEKGGNYNRAAELYLKVKNGARVSEIIDRVTNEDIFIRYAREKEAEGKFREACQCYKKANDVVNLVRVHLDKLNNPAEAVRIVRATASVEGAKLVARYFQRLNDMNSAIEFLVMSKCNEEAYRLAQSTGQIDLYANALTDIQDAATADDFKSLAIYYEQDKNWLKAGKFYCLCNEPKKGIKYLLQAAKDPGESKSTATAAENQAEAIRLLTEAAAKVKDDQHLIRQIIDYLIGENDGLPKDFKHLFRFYVGLKMWREAAKTAVIIAREEQNLGNYRNAHDLLFGMYLELKKNSIKVPNEMYNSLCLIHSYLLAKAWMKSGDHQKSAQMLIRVSKNLSKFPTHTVAILTSTVIECQRAGFRKKAFDFATQLMRSEYRDQMDPKIKRKIETLIRKSAGLGGRGMNGSRTDGEEEIGEETPCPYCAMPLLETELICTGCRNSIPFCMASGHHIIKEGLVTCPSCGFPAIKEHLQKLLCSQVIDKVCPMCSQELQEHQLIECNDVNGVLHSDQ